MRTQQTRLPISYDNGQGNKDCTLILSHEEEQIILEWAGNDGEIVETREIAFEDFVEEVSQ